MNQNTSIQELHETYCRLSKMQVKLAFNRESSWYNFTQAGFTKADLEAVLKRLVRLVEQGERRVEALRFSNTVESLDRFEEELAVIRAEEAGLKRGDRQMSVMELHKVLEWKQANAKALVFAHTREDPFGLVWDDGDAKAQYRKLMTEIRNLQNRIANMA